VNSPPRYRVYKAPGWLSLNIHEVWEYRYLIWAFFLKDLQVRYKHTLLGVLWVLIQPASIIAIMYVISSRFISQAGVNTFHYVSVGYLLYLFFVYPLNNIVSAYQSNEGVIKKNPFPRLVIACSAILSSLLDLLIVGISLFVVLVFTCANFHIEYLPLFILSGLLALVYGCSVGIIFSSLNVIFRDVRYIVPFFVQFVFFATPVFYKPYEWQVYVNPVAFLLQIGRMFVIPDNITGNLSLLFLNILLSFALLFISLFIFRRMEYFISDLI